MWVRCIDELRKLSFHLNYLNLISFTQIHIKEVLSKNELTPLDSFTYVNPVNMLNILAKTLAEGKAKIPSLARGTFPWGKVSREPLANLLMGSRLCLHLINFTKRQERIEPLYVKKRFASFTESFFPIPPNVDHYYLITIGWHFFDWQVGQRSLYATNWSSSP